MPLDEKFVYNCLVLGELNHKLIYITKYRKNPNFGRRLYLGHSFLFPTKMSRGGQYKFGKEQNC